MTHDNERRRLILQIERDLAARASLRTLLAAAEATVAGHRRDLRIVEARVTRNRQGRTR
jgi:hypothetical protein